MLGFAAQRPFANQTELAVMPLKTSAAAERIARIASLSLELASAVRVAAAAANEAGMDFRRVGLYMHGVLDFSRRDQIERRGVANHSPAPLAF